MGTLTDEIEKLIQASVEAGLTISARPGDQGSSRYAPVLDQAKGRQLAEAITKLARGHQSGNQSFQLWERR